MPVRRKIIGILEELKSEASHVEEGVSSKFNPTDIGTQGDVDIDVIGGGSPWQAGPEFLTTRRENWPVRSPSKIVEDKRQAANQKQSSATVVCLTPACKHGQIPVCRTEPELVHRALKLVRRWGEILQSIILACLASSELKVSTRVLARVMPI